MISWAKLAAASKEEIEEIKAIVAEYRPRGFKVVQKEPPWNCMGTANYDKKELVVPSLNRLFSLYIFLHEVGHVALRHDKDEDERPLWREEYEAEQFALTVLREKGFDIPCWLLKDIRDNVRRCIEMDHEHEVDDEVLKFCYGRKWKQHK